ncbi:MAG: hypothetical protein LBQ66_06280 [Planctomycetaceae bacterium]|jgi:hypothetical protein|nr:hypothetical protein [Planctomycetaceae bacterium]
MEKRSQNDLTNFLVGQYEDWIYPNRKILGMFLLAVAVILSVVFYVSRNNAASKADMWEQYFKLLDTPDPLASLDIFANTKDGFFEYQAGITAGQLLLAKACNAGFDNKAQTIETLEKSLNYFKTVRDSRRAEIKFKRQAGLGAAQALEVLAAINTNPNNLTDAINEYQKIVKSYPNTYESKIAETQISLLNKSDTKNFYTKYAAATIESKPNPDDFKVEFDKQNPNAIGNPEGISPALDELFKKDSTPQKTEEKIETKKDESKIDEPKKDESKKDESKKDEPTIGEPKIGEPKIDESKQPSNN